MEQQGVTFVIKRDSRKVKFDPEKIQSALRKAFNAHDVYDEYILKNLTNDVLSILEFKYGDGEKIPTVEDVQDIVEIILIKNNYTKIAKAYMLYREQHKQLRQEKVLQELKENKLNIKKKDGQLAFFDEFTLRDQLSRLSKGLDKVDAEKISNEVVKTIYNGILEEELHNLTLNAIKTNIEKHYQYSQLASRVLLNKMYQENLKTTYWSTNLKERYQNNFMHYIDEGINIGMLSPALKEFDLTKIAAAIEPERDNLFFFLGMQTIYDRYLIRRRNLTDIIELPQYFWMRVAMGLALNETNKEERAIEFYTMLSNFYGTNSTPTLFNSGTMHPQLSSCFLNTVDDSLNGIFKIYSDNAKMCKWAGAVGTDWTPVRSKNAFIKGTNGRSQGSIPFIKIFNDVALAVNQGGKRTGQLAAYMEVWHADIEEFIELRKNTGDERRRAHDIHTVLFIPDLFMKRIMEGKAWTLFSPDTVPGLHDAYGKKFEELYEFYEAQENIPKRTIEAKELWRKALSMLYETGHPWITFKDPMNLRSPQDHKGVIHSSNLCTEITLNTNNEETAVCNLASVNLARMIKNGKVDEELLAKTVTTIVRMLDNVVTNNYYTIVETETSNMRHRPIGLGIMGYQDALYQLGIEFDSEENLTFADESMELVSYYAILASATLAKERGAYPSFKGSKWDRGILPYDTLKLLEEERGRPLKLNKQSRRDWTPVRDAIKQYGMRNSNCMAIAPTATIANITNVVPCVEPAYKNLYVKENMSGNFTIINEHLVDALEKEGLWNAEVLKKIKLNNGSVLNIDEIPAMLRRRFKEVFEIDAKWVIDAAARRAKWIDQAASTNIFLKTTSGKIISDTYFHAWETGLKTTYYLRTLAASQVTKTIEDSPDVQTITKKTTNTDEDCEACQ